MAHTNPMRQRGRVNFSSFAGVSDWRKVLRSEPVGAIRSALESKLANQKGADFTQPLSIGPDNHDLRIFQNNIR